MRTVSHDDWPTWMSKRLSGRKNLEVKEHNGRFYLYTYTSFWDKKEKRPRKVTKYEGILSETIEYRNRVLEKGHVSLLFNMMKDELLPSLQRLFPEQWKYVVAFSMNRAIAPMPLKRIGSWYEKTALSKLTDLEIVTAKTLSKRLDEVGTRAESCTEFMANLIVDSDMLLYDGSFIHSFSKKNKLVELGYDKDGLLLPKANITLLFSKARNLPIYYRLFFGGVHEVKTISGLVEELKDRNIVLIADKGYYKNQLYEDLNASHVKFIMPLPRDDKRIQYGIRLDGLMEYHKRIIRYTSYKSEKYYIYFYEDQYLKFEETSEYYRIKMNRRKVTFHEEWTGTIAIISNIKKNPKDVYEMWKSRDGIEKAFDVLQNELQVDTPYISKEETFKGYMFASFVSLYLYYKVLNLLRSKKINNKISVSDVLFELSKVMVYEKNGNLLEIPKRTHKMIDACGIRDILVKNGWS
jgi:transposase